MQRRMVLSVTLVMLFAGMEAKAQTQVRPDLVVLLAVDQLKYDYLERFRPQFVGGFKRLLDEGAVFSNAYQDHAATVTAVGHASMLSGRFPRGTGIISNALGVPDPQARMLNGVGDGASPFRFRGTTLVDWLRMEDPMSRALSVSVKDRAAILPIGRAKQSVFWYSNDGTFTTSNYYADTLPTWLRRFNQQKLPEKYAGMEWKPLLNVGMYMEADSVAVENKGKDVAFPHRMPTDIKEAIARLANFPWMDEILLDLARTGIDSMQLGRTGHIDLLSVSLSTTDLIGHAYGPDSREVHDQIVRLDRALGAFMDSLYARFPRDKVVIALTADHGVSSIPELHAHADGKAEKNEVDTRPLLAPLARFLTPRKIPGAAVRFEAGMLMLNPTLLQHDRALMDSIAAAFVAAAKATHGVARVDYVRNLARGDTINNTITRRWHNMIPRDLTIPVVATIEEGYEWGSPEGATHGAPYDADAHVPIIFYGPQFKPGRYRQFARTVDIAPTLAEVLRVRPTEPLDGKPLKQAIQ